MRSVGFKITVVMLCVVLLGITVTVGVATTISGNVITNESLGKVQSETGRQAHIMDEWLVYHKASASTIAAAVSQINDYSKEYLTGILNAVLNDNSVYQDVYMGFPDNTAIMGSGYPIEEAYAEGWRATERGWYKLAMADTYNAGITSLYVDTATGDLCITAVSAVKRDGMVIGVIGIDILVNALQDVVYASTLDSTGYSMLLDQNGDILIHPDNEFAPNAKGEFNNFENVKGGMYSDLWKKLSGSNGVYKYLDDKGITNYYTSSTLDATGWRMVTVLPEEVITRSITNVILIVILVAIAILAFAILVIHLTIQNLVDKPLIPIAAFFNRASKLGDISFGQPEVAVIKKYSKQKNEIGQLISSASAFVGRITDVSKVMRDVAGGDLTTKVALLSDKDEMGASLKTMTDNLNHIFNEINASVAQVSVGSKQLADGSQSLAQGSTEQAASIEVLSSSIAEIAERTRANSTMSENSAKLSDAIREDAEKGSRLMDDMMAAVKEIDEASHSISKVIKTIDEIAFQTNILALNAAVEAARAGQHGKGFAVVAEEVRNLASKSAKAAKDTGDMIQNSIEKAELGSRIAGETAASLTEIASGIDESTQLIAEIARASEEQSLDIAHINTGIDQVAQVVQLNSTTAEESATASEEMRSQSDTLAQTVAWFRLRNR
ncbi:MAG: methyl-accepting chemotaxis protein [Oscillospiraceae bacterium]|nr:methyl-accepting chemotaxis protein [Oscillospiraceae bacterium]